MKNTTRVADKCAIGTAITAEAFPYPTVRDTSFISLSTTSTISIRVISILIPESQTITQLWKDTNPQSLFLMIENPPTILISSWKER